MSSMGGGGADSKKTLKSVEQMDYVAPTAEADDDILTQVQQETWYKVSE
jgi:hypothetical protein